MLERQRQANDDPSSVDEAMVPRNALGEGCSHNCGVGRKQKNVFRYPDRSQTTQGTSSTSTIIALEEKILGMQQIMGIMYYNMQQMQQATCSKSQLQPTMQFTQPALALSSNLRNK